MTTTELPSPLPPSARQEQLETYVADVDKLRRAATAASLLLKHEAELSRPASAQLGAILAEIEDSLASLQRRRTVIIPKLRHEADRLDAAYEVAYDALEYIFRIEALLDTLRQQLDAQPNGHLITLADLCYEQMPKLRFTLYGEDMGP